MPVEKLNVTLIDLFSIFSELAGLINTKFTDHQYRVAYLSLEIARELGYPMTTQDELVCAGLIHQIGAISEAEPMQPFDFNFQNIEYQAEKGYHLLCDLSLLGKIPEMIRFQNTPLQDEDAARHASGEILDCNYLLHLASRVSLLIDSDRYILYQDDEICEQIKKQRDNLFTAEIVDAFLEVAGRESVWLNLVSRNIKNTILKKIDFEPIDLSFKQVSEVGEMFKRVIDFRSKFTAYHSTGVSVTAGELARQAGWGYIDCLKLKIAGQMHDLGKLAVPTRILEKKEALTRDEFSIIRSHTFHTHQALENIPAFNEINRWASYHHERLDGTGYPFALKEEELSDGSRMMAIADVFTALNEARPYKKSMKKDEVFKIMDKMAADGKIDKDLYDLLKEKADYILVEWNKKIQHEHAAYIELTKND